MSIGLINQAELYESSNIPEDKKERLRVTGKELALGVDYDRIDVTYPLPTQEVFTYTKLAASVLVIQVNYVASNKKDILSVVSV